MTQTTLKNLNFEEYINYDDGTDNRYELVNGELVMVPLPTADHSDVIDLLSDTFKAEISRLERSSLVKRDVGVYIGIDPATGKDYSRTPDLCVVTAQQWAELKKNKKSSAILRTPPLLAVEVVSPASKKTDYQAKEQEYKTVKIPEYWIVDFRNSKVSVLLLNDECYQITEFRDSERIVSRLFSDLTLTAQQVLSA
ncbi:Uma2 family endonuclease [Trichocoleus sp. DQ-A3]|uniref:Uma2 family endonuclease n=1 Tax=Cyanophyceae TaxID=3028117 RepID=UPI001684186D|nr:Uma2 family endonuclease [Coleofasciculus sp. FACHB-125]MBD1903646.1 Uma2 family endonuclease [Coleofasciculus sp. FACHB-125]